MNYYFIFFIIIFKIIYEINNIIFKLILYIIILYVKSRMNYYDEINKKRNKNNIIITIYA